MPDINSLLTGVSNHVPSMAQRAASLDEAAVFPTSDVKALADLGLLAAPLPRDFGGLGLGTSPEMDAAALNVFCCLGRGNLAVGRVIEAHVNALRLVVRYGTAEVTTALAEDVAAGHLVALWVTDAPGDPLRQEGHQLNGSKQFCSASGYATRAVVTATTLDGSTQLAYACADKGVTITKLSDGLQGMRAASTGAVQFTAVEAAFFGAPGDYLREPDFSAGAWRTSAVTLGGLQALVAEASQQLKDRGRAGDPHQQARMGQAMIAQETSHLWLREAAHRAEANDADPADTIAYVGFARLAVERACLEAITLVQRSLGVAAFLRPNPVERLCRDLGTYLRQPAADMVLTEAAAYRMGV